MGLKSSWLKSLGLKGPGLKGPGLKLGVEKSWVEMSFNRIDVLDFSFEIPDHLYIPMRVTQQPMTGNNLFATIFAGSKKKRAQSCYISSQ